MILALLAYFAAAGVLLFTRYWVLPRVDQWRPDIEQALSDAVGVPVKFDAIDAQWYGLNASLRLTNVRILNEKGVTQVGIPHAEAIVSWRSIFKMEPVFRYLGVDDLVLIATRQEDGRVVIGGFESAGSDDHDTNAWQSPTVRWLLSQGRINVSRARVIWVDQFRKAPPLVFPDLNVTVDNGLLSHSVDVQMALPKAWGGQVELVAKIDAVQGPVSELLANEPEGVVFGSISQIEPSELAPWVDVPEFKGVFGARAWLDITKGKMANLTIDVAGQGANFVKPGQSTEAAKVARFQARLAGPVDMLPLSALSKDWVLASTQTKQWSSTLTLENGSFAGLPDGMQDLIVDQLTLNVAVSHPQPESLLVSVNDLALANADGLVTAKGSWRSDDEGRGGSIDLDGSLARFKPSALHKYLPSEIGEEAHDWLRDAFRAGIVSRASFKIAGPVADFPYGANRAAGVFRVDGSYQDLTLDYAPGLTVDDLPWPLLTDLKGTISLDGDRLSTVVNAGALTLPSGGRITVSGVSADLVDLEGDPVLTIQANTSSDAPNYLGLFKETALKGLAPEFVQNFKGEGRWRAPIRLRIPIDKPEETSFQASLQLDGGSVRYGPSPTVTNVSGVAVISEHGFVSQDLAGDLLGGRVAIDGGIGRGLNTVSARGQIGWSEVAKYTASHIVSDWFDGQMSYDLEATISEDDKFAVTLSSDLQGSAIRLPAPMGKSARQPLETKLTWEGSLVGGTPDRMELALGERLAMSALTQNKPSSRLPFFSRVSLTAGGARAINAPGFTVNVSLPTFKLADWLPAIDTIRDKLKEPSHGGQAIMPGLTEARFAVSTLIFGTTPLPDVSGTLTVTGRDYNLAIAAKQTRGTVRWALDQGGLQDGFVVNFDRLALGGAADKDSKSSTAKSELGKLPAAGTLSPLPPLDITIDDLSLYGSRLGKFRLVGRNSPNDRQWNIEQLMISNPHGELTAHGAGRFYADPGVSLNAELKIGNLGDLTTFLTNKDPVRNGEGTLTADVDWYGLPWQFDYAGLSGKAKVDLKGGVFDHVSSSSARVLELLSLQSISRLFSVNANPDETFAQGFPWNSITGQFDIKRGVVDTQDLSVVSPVATINLTGGSNLVKKTWDLHAVVIPNLDLSGTALATGFLVNPLVGLGALIGQYILRHPVESAMSERLSVTGTWDDPIVGATKATKTDGKPKVQDRAPPLGD